MELSPTSLTVYAAGLLTEAAADLPGAIADELFDRFMAWTRSARRSQNRAS